MFDAPEWDPPADWTRLETIESHTGGEPLRVVVDGLPDIAGDTVLEKRAYVEDHLDDLRKALMWEPRGHADMYGAIPVAPDTEDADMGVVFTHNQGYSTMCGHGIIALATVALETGMLPADDERPSVAFDTPAGPVASTAAMNGDRVESVTFENVPSFVYARDRTVEVPGVGTVPYAVAFGGAFYAYCDADAVGVGLDPEDHEELVRVGRAIKDAVSRDIDIEHPTRDDLSFLYGAIVGGRPRDDDADARNVCVFADGEVDRSPTGTGVSGRLALEVARGTLDVGDRFVVESIVGSTFVGRVRERVSFGGYDAIVPEITGSAHVTGRSEFVVDPEDPFGEGFLLR
ncbi:MAG: proline racemase family protein [Halolamina sp.]